jgi:hypothetical protein
MVAPMGEQPGATVPNPTVVDPQTIVIQQRIIQRMVERGAASPTCPICGHNTWMLGSYVMLPVTPNPNQMRIGTSYPCIAVICRTCGNTHLLNLYFLGFTQADFEGLSFPEVGVG